MGDLRKQSRLSLHVKATIVWQDDSGNSMIRRGTCIDVSQKGVRVELDAPVPVRAFVTIQAPEIGLHGSASVRSCTRMATKYHVGLEFAGGMRLQGIPTS